MATLTILASTSNEQRHSDSVEFVTEYPCHGLFYSGGDDGKLKIWNRDLTLRYEQKLHEYQVSHAAFTTDSIYTCSNSPFIKEWTHLGVDGLVQKRQLSGHTDSVRKLRTSRSRLISGGDDGMVCMWFMENGKCDAVFPVIEEVWDLKVDGDLIFTVRDRGVTVWATCDEDQRFMQCGYFDGHAPLALAPDLVYCVDHDTSTKILAYDRKNEYKLVQTIEASDRIIRSLTITQNVLFAGGFDQTLKAFDRKTGQLIASLAMGADITAVKGTGAGLLLVGLAGGNVKLVEFKKAPGDASVKPAAAPAPQPTA